MSFVEITGTEYTKDLVSRLKEDVQERTWLKQFRNILEPHLSQGIRLIDVGCATGYAYKSFKKYDVEYTGLDFEEEYVNIAGKWFSDNPKATFIQHDIAESPPPCTAEIVICSAILEHCSSLMPALQHLVDVAENVLLIRTFLGEIPEQYSISSKIPGHSETHRKYYNQYSFKDVLGYIEERGFSTRVYRDEYTDGMPAFLDGAIRTFYIVCAEIRR